MIAKTQHDARAIPLLIVGSGRSGTTVLLNALAALPEVGYVPALAGLYPRFVSPVSKLARRGLMPRRLGRPSSEATGLFRRAGFDEEWRSATPLPATRADCPPIASVVLPSVITSASRGFRSKVVAVKNTANAFRLAPVLAALPDAQVLHIVRHPYDVISSLLKVAFWEGLDLWWCGKSPRELAAGGQPQWLTAAEHWARQVSSIETAVASWSPDCQLTVRYEELVVDPVDVLSRVAAWVDVDSSAGTVRQALADAGGIEPRRTTVGKRPPGSDPERLQAVVSDLAARHSYDL